MRKTNPERSTVSLHDIQDAAERINPYIYHTPLLRARNMDTNLGCQVYLKPEMMQITGAFKIRGALNKIFCMTPEERAKGIVLTSSGNHAQACAFAGKMLGIHVTAILPDDAPAIKGENARAMGAEVIFCDRSYDKRWAKVLAESEKYGYVVLHAYDDYDVMAGQGTIALEIFKDLPDVDTILVPLSGGGLLSGISTAVKALKPSTRVIGIQAAASCAYYLSRRNGFPSEMVSKPSVADGLNCSRTSKMPYPIIEKNVDDIAIVEEEDILKAVRLIGEKAKLIAEPSAAVGIATLLSGRVKAQADEKVCSVLSGGNWDLDSMGRIYTYEFRPTL